MKKEIKGENVLNILKDIKLKNHEDFFGIGQDSGLLHSLFILVQKKYNVEEGDVNPTLMHNVLSLIEDDESVFEVLSYIDQYYSELFGK